MKANSPTQARVATTQSPVPSAGGPNPSAGSASTSLNRGDHSASYGQRAEIPARAKRPTSLISQEDGLDAEKTAAAGLSRPAIKNPVVGGLQASSVAITRHSFIEDGRARREQPARTLPKDESGHPQAAKFAGVHEWNDYNEHHAVRGVQRHFNRGLDPIWPDISKGTESSKRQRAKGIVNHILSRATKILYKKDRRGNEVVEYRMHLPGKDVKVGPGIENGGSGVMYDQKGVFHMTDRTRADSVLEAHQIAHDAKMQARAAKKAQSNNTPQSPV